MTGPKPPDSFVKLRALMMRFSTTQMLRAAVELGIPDALAAGPLTTEQLGSAVKAHAPSLRRLLRALTRAELFAEDSEGRYALTPLSDNLRSDAPGSMRAAILYFGAPYIQAAWSALPQALRTGQPAFDQVHGMSYWDYLDAHPEDGAMFNRALATMRPHHHAAVAATYDFAGVRKLVDVGGGCGQLTTRILGAHPQLCGLVMDAPGLQEQAEAHIDAAGLSGRCGFVAGSFFERVPEGGDVYLLGDILHDWPDTESTRILQTLRQAMAPHSRLLIVEVLASPAAGPGDLHMMVLFGEGRQRSPQEFAELFAAAGLQLSQVIATGTDVAIVEARPA